MKLIASRAVPTHIISGFLGAGKTTLLQHLLSQKPENEVWAVLMNEFGQIGRSTVNFSTARLCSQRTIRGCLCCSSQLPMQIALSRLSESKPDRLFIEPTGLGHPAQLLEQLTEPHWQNTLDMRALVIVVDGSRLHDQAWVEQNLYTDQLKAAQIVVISHVDCMSDEDREAYLELKQEYQTYVRHWIEADHGIVNIQQLDMIQQPLQRKVQPLLKQQSMQANSEDVPAIKQLPYHYVETSQGYTVAG